MAALIARRSAATVTRCGGPPRGAAVWQTPHPHMPRKNTDDNGEWLTPAVGVVVATLALPASPPPLLSSPAMDRRGSQAATHRTCACCGAPCPTSHWHRAAPIVLCHRFLAIATSMREAALTCQAARTSISLAFLIVH